jgi:hypothetical protein
MSPPLKTLAKRLPPPLRRPLGQARDLLVAIRNAIARPYLVRKRAYRRRRVGEIEASRRPVALFLSPDAGLEMFHSAHVITARTIAGQGLEPLFLSCDGLLPICTLKEVTSTGPTKPSARSAVCARCRHAGLSVGSRYGLVDVTIESLLTQNEMDRIATTTLQDFDSLLEFEHDQIPFGALVLGDTLRRRRLTDASELGEGDRDLFKALLYAALAIYSAMVTLSRRFDIKRIAFFGDYAYWLPVQIFANRNGIGLAGFDYGYNVDVDTRYIGIRPVSANAQALQKVRDWPLYRHLPLPPEVATTILEGGLQRLGAHGGRTNFSPNWICRTEPLQKELGLSLSRKTIVAYPSSSDEFVAQTRILSALGVPFASQNRPFLDQVEWLDALVDWVGNREDLQLAVRWHPRIGASRYSNRRASEYDFFKQRYATHPSNVVMIWPEEKVSSYNLGEICDVAAVSWSTIGLELARLGVPVLASFPDIGTYPTGGFVGFGETSEEYFRALEKALSQSASLASIQEAVRWSYYIFWSPLVDVSDVVPSASYHKVPKWKPPANTEVIRRVMIDGDDLSVLNMSRLPSGTIAGDMEKNAILSVIRSAITFFTFGQNTETERLPHFSVSAPGYVAAKMDGVTVTRYSPLAARLVSLLDGEGSGQK